MRPPSDLGLDVRLGLISAGYFKTKICKFGKYGAAAFGSLLSESAKASLREGISGHTEAERKSHLDPEREGRGGEQTDSSAGFQLPPSSCSGGCWEAVLADLRSEPRPVSLSRPVWFEVTEGTRFRRSCSWASL